MANFTSKNVGLGKFFSGPRHLGSVYDKTRSLVFSWFVFTFLSLETFLPKSLGLGFLTRISASRRVSDFTTPEIVRRQFSLYLRVNFHKCVSVAF